jgi:uncharacterized membrane protein
MARSIGNRVAPAKFIAFMALLIVAAPAAIWGLHVYSGEQWREAAAKGFLVAFDLAAALFLLFSLHMLKVNDQKAMRAHAAANDANRTMLLVIVAIVSLAVLLAVGVMTGTAPGWKTKLLIVGTLLTAWLFANSVWALHYAHLAANRGGGLEFPGKEAPGYADFVYFSFTLGMTFQTSDVAISDRGIRNVVTAHCLVAFVFNLGILAFTINVLGG